MKLLPILILAFALSLGVACSPEPSFEESVAKRVAEKKIEEAAVAQIEAEASATAEAEAKAAAEAYRSSQARREAVIALLRAKEHAEKRAEPYRKKAVAHWENGEFELAIQTFRQVALLHPQDHEADYLIGEIYYELGQYELAIQAYDEAIRIGINNDEWPYSRGGRYASDGSYYRRRGDAYYQLGNTAMAAKDYGVYLEWCTAYSEARAVWGAIMPELCAAVTAIGPSGFSPPTSKAAPTPSP